MSSVWNMITALTTLAGVIGGLIVVWWKVKSENDAIRKEVIKHDEQIIVLITTKANCTDMIKLGDMVGRLEAQISTHHQDAKVHRTEDFEKRMDALIDAVNTYQVENRRDHERISDLISKK